MLEAEFRWSDDTARRYVRMHGFVESRSVRNLEAFAITALEILSRPSTSEAVREEALAEADKGKCLTATDVRQLLKDEPERQPANNPAAATETVEEQVRRIVAGTPVERSSAYMADIRAMPEDETRRQGARTGDDMP